MNPVEYTAMAQAEDHHWWFCAVRGAFEAVLHHLAMQTSVFSIPPGSSGSAGGKLASAIHTIIDAGCGTGGNLKWLRTLYPHADLIGFDVSATAIEIARERVPESTLFVANLCQPPFNGMQPGLIICSDVLYTTPLPAGIQGLRELCGQLAPDGRLLLHLPAYNWMKSRHDEAVHTRQRFTASEVRRMFADLGLRLEFLSYRVFLLFPALVCLRLPSILSKGLRQCQSGDSELRIPSSLINRMLKGVMSMENFGLRIGLRYPWGSSLIAVGKKP